MEKKNHAMLCDLHAAQEANVFGNAVLQSTKQYLQEVKTQVSSLANAAKATTVAAKAFLQAESDHNGTESQMQYAACNSAVNDMICHYHAIMGTNSDVAAANNRRPIATSDDNDTGASDNNSFGGFFKWRVNSVIYKSYSKQIM